MKQRNKQSGIGLIEVVIAVTILSISLASILAAFRVYLKAGLSNTNIIKATYLAEEGAEVARLLRDNSWSRITALGTSTPYYLSYATSTKIWTATTSATKIDGLFLRTISAAPVYRDSNMDIATTGTLDPNTKLISVNVDWVDQNGSSTRKVKLYLSNLFGN